MNQYDGPDPDQQPPTADGELTQPLARGAQQEGPAPHDEAPHGPVRDPEFGQATRPGARPGGFLGPAHGAVASGAVGSRPPGTGAAAPRPVAPGSRSSRPVPRRPVPRGPVPRRPVPPRPVGWLPAPRHPPDAELSRAAAAAARGTRARLDLAGGLHRRADGRPARRCARGRGLRPAHRQPDRGDRPGRPGGRRHRLPASAEGGRLDRGRRPGAAAEHGADLGRVRRQEGWRDGLRLRPGPPGARRHQQPRGRRRRGERRTHRDRRPGRQPLHRDARRPELRLRPRGPLREARQRPQACLPRIVASPACGRRRGRDRVPARAELHGHRRHRQRAEPAGHDRRHGRRLVVHQRRADRRRDQPRQLGRTAGQPARPGGRR